MPLCGGTSQQKEATDEIQSIIEEIRAELEEKVGQTFPQYKAISYKSQIVAGTNYFVKIQVDDQDYVHVRIYRSLPHAGSKLEVSNFQLGKTKDDHVEYF